jgi:phage terminase large subunit-like protein
MEMKPDINGVYLDIAPKGSNAYAAIHWIHDHCVIPEGKFVAKEVRLRRWQQADLAKIYNNPAGTRRAILSFGRKNAKTTFSAFLLLLHLAGPPAVKNSQLFSAAQSRDQAALIFSLASKIVRMSPKLCNLVSVKESAKQLICAKKGTLYRALSAESTTAFGLSPVFIVHDELGQVKGPRSELYEALETATGAQENPLSIIISTQAPTDADLLSILIDDALMGHDPTTVVSLHTAPIDDDPFDIETIKKANPAFGDFLNEKEVLAMAENARRMPSREAGYRNLVLNQRVEASNPFVTRSVWQANGAEAQDLRGIPLYAGLDLSSVNDLTALVLMGKIDNKWHVRPTFWLPSEGLAEKSKEDRVPYDVWAKNNFLYTTPGPTVSYEFVANHLFKLFSIYTIRKIAFDRWNMKHLKPWLIKAGFSETKITDCFVEFGQGTQSMSPALRDLEAVLLAGEMAHSNHPVLAMCAACAVVEGKDDANRKLSKNKSTGRIDGMVALTMAMGVAPETTIDVSTLIC